MAVLSHGIVRGIGLVCLTAALIVVLAPRTLGGSTSYVIVSGTSMEPNLYDGDLVLARSSTDYEVGDVVAFDSGRGMVIHRIIDEGDEGFVMQGDNKERPDQWTPTEEEILGKQLVKVPRAGRWVSDLHQRPHLLGAVIGGLGSIGILGSRRRRRRHGAHAAEGESRRRVRSSGGTSLRGAGTLLALFALLLVMVGAAFVFFLLRPAERSALVEVERFQNTGQFSYTASMHPSIIYGTDTVQPSADGSPTPPIYTELLRGLTIDFSYALAAEAPTDVSGALSADLTIRAGDEGWVRSLEILPPQEFEGTSAEVSFDVDWPTVTNLIDTAEEEAGLAPSEYLLSVVTTVMLTGQAEEPIEDTFVAELPMQLTNTELMIDEETLSVSESVTEPRPGSVPNDVEIFGTSIPVGPARAVTGAIAGALLLLGGGYAFLVHRRLGSGEAARIRLLYGSLIVPVTNGPEGDRTIEVASMADLVRLARKSEQMVFHHQPTPDQHRFFVPDGSMTYDYRVSVTRRQR